MSKLKSQDKFLDLSDYGRPLATRFALALKNSSWTPIHVTYLFGVCGLIAIFFILTNNFVSASIFIILKSIIDAADGELSRIKNEPSHTGRYLDSIFDILLNILFFMAMCYVSRSAWLTTFTALICFQLQGTLYNYYNVILRNKSKGGDNTSKIFELKPPRALGNEDQNKVDLLFNIFYILYGSFDKIIYLLDSNAYKVKTFPNWFMTAISIYGLGFQLLIIAIMLPLQLIDYVVPFFIYYTLFLFYFYRNSKIFNLKINKLYTSVICIKIRFHLYMYQEIF
ncbi:MAG: CDP-alcohol phosphatidyltransferase family protein [Saprospiraceae bacterium]|nr:CDP-alcohol phosphatidyltransferase family protein [Saprospiraceae bacterium]